MASGEVPRIGTPSASSAAGQLQRRLAAELDHHPDQFAARALDVADLEHVLDRQGLEIQPVGGVVVGGDRLRIAVDHDRLHPELGEREGGVAAAVVELDPLPDPVRTAAQDDGLAPVGRLRLVLGDLAQRAGLIGRVHIGRGGIELRRAGVDALEHGTHAQRPADLADLALGLQAQLRQPGVAEAH
jgi:hypothetical protein